MPQHRANAGKRLPIGGTYASAGVLEVMDPDIFDIHAVFPGIHPDDLARIEHEMRIQEKDFRMLDETYNEHVMALTIARGYLRPLLDNNRVVRFLAQNFREFLTEFQRIVETSALDG